MADDDIQPKEAPNLNIPASNVCCDISAIYSTLDFSMKPKFLVEPDIPAHEWMNLRTVTFHITNQSSGRQILFDLSLRKDWWNSVPIVADFINDQQIIPNLRALRDVLDILPEGGVDVNKVEGFVLSHFHFDHCGNPAALPKSTTLVVGPGFKERFMPGWPAKESSWLHEADFEGREVHEVEFSDFKLGRFPAYDYFGDGSFYILDSPGHATGHISALVRTTPDTFALLAGDICHFGGVLRPNPYTPLPKEIPQETRLEAVFRQPCPSSAFTACHPDQKNSRTTPFYRLRTGADSLYEDPAVAQASVDALIEFDAHPNVLVIIAHDPTSIEVLNLFPNGMINDWKKKGFKEAMRWGFLNQMPYDGKQVQERCVDGLYKLDKRIKDVDGNPV